jgi:hypothetical protein
MGYIKDIFDKAQIEARKYALEAEGDNIMVYPCGFAWVELKCRKNSKIGKELEKEGIMDWDDYEKRYKYWIGDYNQSMLHKAAHGKKLAEILSSELFAEFEMKSRMD